jgi:predicted nucleic acid-binding protein
MPVCFDTGLLTKLYTVEPETPAVAALVASLTEPVIFTDFHRAELTSALHRKQGRGEITTADLAKALANIQADLQFSVLLWTEPDWKQVFAATVRLCSAHSADTHCRTLDAMHVALAQHLRVAAIATTDKRQRALATAAGLKVLTP